MKKELESRIQELVEGDLKRKKMNLAKEKLVDSAFPQT
jgi:hypothetical protein